MNSHVLEVDQEQFLADLAWEFCQKVRTGKRVSMKEYLEKCPNDKMRSEFKRLVNMSTLLELADDLHRDGTV